MNAAVNPYLRFLLNPQNNDAIEKKVVLKVLPILKIIAKTETEEKLETKLGLKNRVISQIKIGRMNLKLDALSKLATELNVSLDTLINSVCEKLFIVSDKSKKQAFLADLQALGGFEKWTLFESKLGTEDKKLFYQKGIFPYQWLELIKDRGECFRLISEYCDLPKNKPDNRTIFNSFDELEVLSGLELIIEDIIESSYAAGRASVLQLSEQSFLGELIIRLLKKYEELALQSDSNGKSVTITFKDKEGNTFSTNVDLSKYMASQKG